MIMVRRNFMPGSEWLYLKIYSGIKTGEDILIHQMRKLTNLMIERHCISNFFFIRYYDPDYHLRLRFKVNFHQNNNVYSKVFSHLLDTLQPLMDNGTISKICCDTYVRELERYGTFTIDSTEELFGIDSLSIMELKYLSLKNDIDRNIIDWGFTLILLDDLMTTFELNTNDKLSLMEKLSTSFRTEFSFTTKKVTQQLKDKYRIHKHIIETITSKTHSSLELYQPIFNHRKKEISRIYNIIKQFLHGDDPPIEKNAYLISIMHMTMNRWFKAKNRICEMIVYDMLYRYYKSLIARNN